MKTEIANGIAILCCYSKADEELRQELEMHLSVAKRQGLIKTWTDYRFEEANEQDTEFLEKLNNADVILLLISPEFISSGFSTSTLMRSLVKKHDAGKTSAIPIILRPTDLEQSFLDNLEAIQYEGNTITTWSDINDALYNVAQTIRETTEERLAQKMGDEEIVQLLATDLDAHFLLLYYKYEKRLYMLAYRMLLSGKRVDSNDEAEDIVQRTMLRAYYALKGLSQERIVHLKLFPFLRTIAIHEVQRILRRTQADVESQLLIEDGRSVFEHIQDDLGLTPETLLERAETIEQIEREIKSLPSTYEDVMIQYYIEDRKEDVIARELGISLNAVKSRIRRAKILLQAKLKPLLEEDR